MPNGDFDFLVPKKSVHQILWEQGRALEVDTALAQADPSILGHDDWYNLAGDKNPFGGVLTPENFSVPQNMIINLPSLNIAITDTIDTFHAHVDASANEITGMMKASAAKKLIKDTMVRHIEDFKASIDGHVLSTHSEANRWRAMAARNRAIFQGSKIAGHSVAKLKLIAAKRRGLKSGQIISTRNIKKFNGKYGVVMFNGKPAFRRHAGRLPISESLWLRRYRERRLKRNKTDVTHPEKWKVRVPKTVNKRPGRTFDPKKFTVLDKKRSEETTLFGMAVEKFCDAFKDAVKDELLEHFQMKADGEPE